MILFFGPEDPNYGFLSNFYPSPIVDGLLVYPTVEHFFQSRKTTDIDKYREFAACATPLASKKLGRTVQLRSDWEEVRIYVMLEALREKFKIPELRAKLLATGEEILSEDSPSDKIWGGRDGGRDLLGKCLMITREALK